MATKFKNIQTGEEREFDAITPELSDQGFVPLGNTPAEQQNPEIITADNLAPSPVSDFNAPAETPPFDVSKIEIPEIPEQQLTQTETQAQGLSDELTRLNEALLGQSAFRAEQEQAQGLPDLLKTQRDLQSQIKAIQNEAQAIPLQLQQEATGRGITAGGLRPLQTGRLRENAIQALTTSSLLEASRGNIATAQDLVDRAVAQKYDPIKEQIAVNKENLQLILQSPQYDLEQKNRAQAQLQAQEAREQAIAEQEAEETAIKNLAVQAAQNGADAETLRRIQNAPNQIEAARIAQESGVFATAGDQFTLSPGETRFDAQGNIIASVIKPNEDPLDELLSPNELVLFNAPAGSTMRDVLGNIPKSELTETQKFTEEIKLGQQFENLVGDSRSAATAVENINSSLDLAKKAQEEGRSINAASQGVLVAFQKLLDPTSVVRESEYARSGAGQSLWDRMKGTWDKIVQGGAGVTFEELENFVNTANTFLKGYENTALKHAKRMKTISERQGLDLNSILTEDMIDLLEEEGQPNQYNSYEEWLETEPTNVQQIEQVIIDNDLNEEETLQLLNRLEERKSESFSMVGGDTQQAPTGKSVVDGISFEDRQYARTDRHNNPTAFTTNIAEQAGLVEGKDYLAGDKFPDSNLRTAALIGDPIEKTIKVIDNIGFYTQGGNQRWKHTAMSKEKWDNLTYKQKSDVIKDMYRKEGNKGLLTNKFV